MCNLVELEEHEYAHEVHEGRIELEGDVGRTDVVASRHYTLQS